MDGRHFDVLTRNLTAAGSRRSLLGLLATLPILGGLFALVDLDETDARGRRKRRKKGHKHGKGRRRQHHKRKKPCTPDSLTTTCAGRCGSAANNCKQTVDCGSCTCAPQCQECLTCQEAAGVPGTCVPEAASTPCGVATFCSDGTRFPQGSCDGDGNCMAGIETPCSPYTQCDGNACASSCGGGADCVDGSFCNDDDHCVAQGEPGDSCDTGDECLSGFCVGGVCCASASCDPCQTCAGGACAADPSQNREVCDGSGAATSICCNGNCWDGCCDAAGEPGPCLVFLTSSRHSADLGGLDAADGICQSLAESPDADLPGAYRAWLSTGNDPDESPASGRFRQSGQPYTLVGGAQIAANWATLTDGTIDTTITVSESGTPLGSPGSVWSNTSTTGAEGSRTADCSGWTSAVEDSSGGIGFAGATNAQWTDYTVDPCDFLNRLYCFQQS